MMKSLFITLTALAAIVSLETMAQVRVGEGQLSGSFETTSTVYMEDKGLNDVAPDDRFGSNNYLKVDYTRNRFSAGIQLEGYFPALQGYDVGVYGSRKFMLASKYVRWQDKNLEMLVGNIYDQFGNGLIFRSYEDRQLGFNNSLEGVFAKYDFGGYVNLKAMYGRPRLYTDYADSWVRGADLSISLGDIFKWENIYLTLEGSYVNRYQKLYEVNFINPADLGMSTNLNMYSGRLNFDWKGLAVSGEYALKSKDWHDFSRDVAEGNAILANVGYSYGTFSVSGTFRRLENMNTMLSLYGQGTGNVLNYLPALTMQNTYMLTNLNPYQVNAYGEIGGQVDLYYSLRSRENRRRYWNFHANFSTYYSLENKAGKNELFWREVTADVERQWNKSLKTTLYYSRQETMLVKGDSHATASNIFVADVLYKFNRKYSLRAEFQYLYAEKYKGLFDGKYEGDWVAALVEFNIAPQWSIFISDMYNHGVTGKHYYNGGVSWSKSRTRVQLSYGRNREGYVCSGGVCRYSPAYTGVNLALTTSF